MGPIRHWKELDAERTLCGRVPKGREVDMEWPLCKTCDRLSEYYDHVYTFPPTASGNTITSVSPDTRTTAGNNLIAIVMGHSISVRRLRKKLSRRKVS